MGESVQYHKAQARAAFDKLGGDRSKLWVIGGALVLLLIAFRSCVNVDPQGLREAAHSRFDVNTGIARYAEIYRRLTSRKTSTSRGA